MEDRLKEIILNKQIEIESLIESEKKDPAHCFEKLLSKPQKNNHSFRESLKVAGLSVIAEIKRKAPLRGEIATIKDPAELARSFSKAGAAAISVSTDFKYYGGCISDLEAVANKLDSLHPCPILRKDFIIHPYQIAEAKKAKASAVLLIASLLNEKLEHFIKISDTLGLDALVEVHHEDDLKRALDLGAEIIGVNNIDLKTHTLNLEVSRKLISKIPNKIVKIAQSGILSLEDAREMHALGYDGVIVGEFLLKSPDPRALISEIGNI